MTVLTVVIVDGAWFEYLENVVEGDRICHRLRAEQLDVPSGYVQADCGQHLHSWRCAELPDILLPGSRSAPWCDACCDREWATR